MTKIERDIAAYKARRPPRISALGGDLSDDEYADIVAWLRYNRIPFSPYSSVIVVNGGKHAGKTISSPDDAMRMGWKP